MTAANDDRQQLRAVLADAIQAARSGTTGTPPNVDGLTTDEALNIMGHGLIEADNLLREDEEKSSLPDYQVRDLELRLNAVRAQRDAAVQQSLDHAATIAVLRRKLDGPRAERIGYCESTFTAPDGVEYVCALDAGHKANLHRDASLHYAWDDNAKTPEPVADAHGIEHNDMRDACADVEQCDECETVGQNCRTHALADAHVDGVHTCGVANTTPRGNRVVCALHPGHGQQHHSAGGFRWTNEARP